MGLSGQYGYSASETERMSFLDEAYRKGEWFWDTGMHFPCRQSIQSRHLGLIIYTADKYGDSEDILGKWFAANPEKRKDIFLATKFGIKYTDTEPGYMIDSSPEYCRTSIESSLKRLGLPFVDLYYIHRLDKITPIEKTMEVMVALKNAGKIKFIGLSECSSESLRRAHAIHPITCVQIEYSLFCTEIESPNRKLLETARELGVAIVAYSPLGNGLLTGMIRKAEDVRKPGDKREYLPWLQKEHIEKNMAIIDQLAEVAKAKNITLPQLALAWLLAQGDDIFPIPGSSRIDRLESNLKSLSVSLSKEEESFMRQLAQGVAGGRFQDMTGYSFGDTPALES